MTPRCGPSLTLVLGMFAVASAASAQTRATTGDVRVIAVDEVGAPLSQARVSITSADTGLVRHLAVTANGETSASALPIGRYVLRAEASGFASVSVDDVDIELGTITELRLTMRLATLSASVDVAAPMPLVDIQRSVIATVISDEQIATLPIDRRNYISFAVLVPAVATDRTPNQGPTETTGLSIAGQSARANNITVDGLDNNDDTTGGVRAVFSQDAVREFQVIAHSYSAEFGKASGGVVNIVTKSGTNRVASDIFGFFRDHALNSRGYFDDFNPAGAAINLPKAPFHQQQFGGTLSGPLIRNRTFGFVSFERLAVDDSATVAIDERPVQHPFLPMTLGTPGDILGRAGFPAENGNLPFEVRMTTALGKVDHALTGSTNLAVRFNLADGSNGNSQPFGGIVAHSRGGRLDNRDYALATSLASVRPRLVNELRVQIAHRNQVVRSLDERCGGECIGNDQGGPALEIIGIARVGRHNFTPQPRKSLRYQALDTISIDIGRHLVKSGVDFNVVDNYAVALPLNFGGQFVFVDLPPPLAAAFGLPGPVSAIQAFALGLPVAYFQGFGDPNSSETYADLSAFVQDEWRPTNKLSLRGGLRYQKQFWPSGYASGNFDFAPRVGVAWDPVGDGRTGLAASYGLFFDNQFTSPVGVSRIVDGRKVRAVVLQGAPAVAAWRAPDHRLPTQMLSALPSLTLAVAPSFDLPYTHQYSVSVNRRATSNIAFSASGIAAVGSRYVSGIDYNPTLPDLGPGRRPADVNGVAGTSATMLQYTPWGGSWYRALLLSSTARPRGGTEVRFAYTLSKAEDSISDFIGNPPQNQGRGPNPQNPEGLPLAFDPSSEKGPSLQDQRHRLAVTGMQELPYGFQFAGIFTAGSGRPYNIIAGADLNGDGDALVSPGPDRARTVLSDPSTSVSRNTERLPHETRLDARITKRFVAGRTTVSLTLDVLNMLNVTNFTDINRVFGTGSYPSQPLTTYGQYTQAGPPRQLQIGARVSF